MEIGQTGLMPRADSEKISPEPRIAVFGFLSAFVWEMWQMPLYDSAGMSYVDMATGCTLAAFGDAGIMVAAYWLTGKIASQRYWLYSLSAREVLIFILIGEVITIVIEHIALNASFGWTYAPTMPVVPIIDVGLAPFAMWIVVPLVTVQLARWGVRDE